MKKKTTKKRTKPDDNIAADIRACLKDIDGYLIFMAFKYEQPIENIIELVRAALKPETSEVRK